MQAHKRFFCMISLVQFNGRGTARTAGGGSDDFDADGFDGPLDHPARDTPAHFSRSEGGSVRGVVGRPPLSTDCPVLWPARRAPGTCRRALWWARAARAHAAPHTLGRFELIRVIKGGPALCGADLAAGFHFQKHRLFCNSFFPVSNNVGQIAAKRVFKGI